MSHSLEILSGVLIYLMRNVLMSLCRRVQTPSFPFVNENIKLNDFCDRYDCHFVGSFLHLT